MKTKLLKIVNPLLAVLFIVIVTAALLHETISSENYKFFHVLPGFLFSFLVLVHFFLNFGWVKSQIRKKK